jgi:hypothetical protein
MATPEYNHRQVLQRVYDKIKNALRVLVVNDLGSPIPVILTTSSGNTTTTIFNVPCAVAGTEYSQALPANTKGFVLKARKSSKILFAYSPSAPTFLTFNAGFSFSDDNFYTSATLYFKCSVADEVVEILAYS